MSRYILSPRARGDLIEIWEFTVSRWSAEQAERYTRQIQRAVETIATDPESGVACDLIRPGYRKLRVGSHVIFYRQTKDAVDIVRILHARMDFDRHL